MIHPNFIYLGIFLQTIGGVDYLIGTIKGTVKPNRVSWFLWGLFPSITFVAQIQQGVGSEAWVTFFVGLFNFVIFFASFINKKSVWSIKKLDIVCGALALVGLVLWLITRSGNMAIVFSIIADALASMPTLIKSWHNPETESVSAYFLGILNIFIGLLVIKVWHFENYAFLVYILIVTVILTILIQFKIGALFKKNATISYAEAKRTRHRGGKPAHPLLSRRAKR